MMSRFAYLSAVLLLLLLPGIAFGWSGNGRIGEPYVLTSCSDLNNLPGHCDNQNVYFELGSDIDCAGFGDFTPVCADGNEFTGHLDGKYYEIKNITINASANGKGALFSSIADGGSVSNLALVDFNVWNSGDGAAALVNLCSGCDVSNVYVYGATIATGGLLYAGGLVAFMSPNGSLSYDANITNVYVDNSYVYGDNADGVGGVVGTADGHASAVCTVQNARSSAVVQGKDESAGGTAGGVVGQFVDNVDGNTSNYWDYQASGVFHSAFGQVLTTANSYKEASYDANWDFSGVWLADEDVNYPTLRFLNVPDANFWQVDGYDINAGLPAFDKDQNITLTFTVLDADNDRVTVDINFSTQASEGTGTVLVEDLNLDSDLCDTTDWSTVGAVCSWDWNASTVSDSNYFILLEFTAGSDENFLVSQSAFRVAGDLNVLVKAPKDEKTNATLSTTKYTYSVSILDGNTFNEFDGLTVDENGYAVTAGTDYYVVFTVDTNTSADYYPRSYYKKYGASEIYAVLQPYLVPVADGAEVTFYTKDAADNSTVPNVRIEAYRAIEGVGRTNVETIRTDDSGAGTMSMLVDEQYELVVFDEDDVELFTKTIRANFTSYYVYIDISSITWEEPTLEWIDISGFPSGPLLYGADGFDINISLDVNGGTASKRWLTIMQDDTNLLFNTSCTADCNFHITKAQMDGAMEIRVVVFVETDSGLMQRVSKNFIPVDSSGYNLISTLQGDDFRTEWGCSSDPNEPCFFLLMVAVMLTIGAVASAGIGLTTDRSALSILAAIVMGIFVYLLWIPLGYFLLMCLAVFGTMVISRRVL